MVSFRRTLIGILSANDASQNITHDDFVKTYLNFLSHLRVIYHTQPILVFTPWGWPNADGTIGQYLQGSYQTIVNAQHALGDRNVFLVDTTGWVTFDDVYSDNQHPNVAGHRKIADLFGAWLRDWGLRPQVSWSTMPSE